MKRHYGTLLLGFVTVMLCVEPSSAQTLADMARKNRESKAGTAKSGDLATHGVADLVAAQDFDGLEGIAAAARSSKERSPGGIWKLYEFYQAVSKPPAGAEASDAEWVAQLNLLKQWKTKRPQSATPRIALAQAYLDLGNKARGSGYANTVTAEGWQLQGQNTEKAVAMLKEAAALPGPKCPYLYAGLMQVATTQGWPKARTKVMVEESIALEPGFYHVYRFYTNYLQTKWHGDEGDAVAFIESISRRVGGDEGKFLYFELATVLLCNNCGNFEYQGQLSWPRIKEGYSAMRRLYGTSPLKQGRYADMAAMYGER